MGINSHAILNEKKEVVLVDLMTWARWLENKRTNRIVGKTRVLGFLISTVFLGLDHRFYGEKPIWFESMVFRGDDSDFDMERYSTYDEALAGHKKMVGKWIFKSIWYYVSFQFLWGNR